MPPDHKIFRSAKYRKAEGKTYPSIPALARVTGIPKELLSLAKERGFPGFRNNGNVNWTELKPAFEKEFESLASTLPKDDPKVLKAELLKRDIQLRDIKIRKQTENLLEPEDVFRLLDKLGARVSAVIKNEFAEMVPKLVGQSEADVKIITDKSLKNIFAVFGDLTVQDVLNESRRSEEAT